MVATTLMELSYLIFGNSHHSRDVALTRTRLE